MIKVLTVFGTRLEAIKIAPLVIKLAGNENIDLKVCVSAQHREMLDGVLSLFSIEADYDLDIMSTDQDLFSITINIIANLKKVYLDFKPDYVLVHGDISTTFSASLAAFYLQIPVGHMEAGLRTGNMLSPWPEEANIKLTGVLSSIHFAPTQKAKQNLLDENVPKNSIIVTGNTVVDSLHMVDALINSNAQLITQIEENYSSFIRTDAKFILITGHRRENFGKGFENFCTAISMLAKRFSKVNFVYPVHLNPNVQKPVQSILNNLQNVYLLKPLDYLPFILLLKQSYMVLTDSGGIQEEAPSLGKPVLVLRETTERPEAVEADTVKLVGTDIQKIVDNVQKLLTDTREYNKCRKLIIHTVMEPPAIESLIF